MININKINFSKNKDGLIPVVIQDYISKDVRMLGYMNQKAIEETIDSGFVTFYSRSKKRLWQKGEESGNTLIPKSIQMDCDCDTLLIQVIANGPTCHLGADTCFAEKKTFIDELSSTIHQRRTTKPDDSYVAGLFEKGLDKIIQKVGEEAVELVIESKNNDKKRLISESADLLFHLMILWEEKSLKMADIFNELYKRKRNN